MAIPVTDGWTFTQHRNGVYVYAITAPITITRVRPPGSIAELILADAPDGLSISGGIPGAKYQVVANGIAFQIKIDPNDAPPASGQVIKARL